MNPPPFQGTTSDESEAGTGSTPSTQISNGLRICGRGGTRPYHCEPVQGAQCMRLVQGCYPRA